MARGGATRGLPLTKKLRAAGRKAMSAADLKRPGRKAQLPKALADTLRRTPLVGVSVSLTVRADRSKLGARSIEDLLDGARIDS